LARKPKFVRIGPGLSLGYRRNHVAGTWVLRVADGKGGAVTRAMGTADDFTDADGATVLNYWQAQEKAPISGAQFERTERAAAADCRTRRRSLSGETGGEELTNSARHPGRLNLHFLNKFGDALVTSLTKSKLEAWLNSMALKSPDREAVRRSKDMANRVLSMVKALLNHTLRDPANGITDDHAWRLVKPYHGVAMPRATHFSEAQARTLIEATPDKEFANLLTAGFLTGARYGELIACSGRDFDEEVRTLSVDGKTSPAQSFCNQKRSASFNLFVANEAETNHCFGGVMEPLERVASATPDGDGAATGRSRSRRDVLRPTTLLHFSRYRGGGPSEHYCGELRNECENHRDDLCEGPGQQAPGLHRTWRSVFDGTQGPKLNSKDCLGKNGGARAASRPPLAPSTEILLSEPRHPMERAQTAV
jgi:hypothetical protein